MKNAYTYVLTALVLLACIVRIASAEEAEYWTSNADLYYHSYAECLGEAERVPISADAADSFGKAPCPICTVPGDASTEPAAAWAIDAELIRVPEGWFDRLPSGAQEIDYEPVIYRYSGNEAFLKLAELYCREEYARAMDAYMAGTLDSSAFELTATTSNEVAFYDGRMPYGRRRLNGAIYYLVQWTGAGYVDGLLYECFDTSEKRVWTENGVLCTQYNGNQDLAEPVAMIPEQVERAEFAADYGDLHLEVYPALGAHIVRIQAENWPDGAAWENTGLKIGDYTLPIQLGGYGQEQDNHLAYVALRGILSDVELAALQGGAEAHLIYRESAN